MTRSWSLSTAILLGALLGPPAQGAPGPSPHADFSNLLGRYVRGGRVDYAGFKADEAALDTYLEVLARTNPRRLGRPEALAFWINAYNAFTVKLILKSYPGIKSIKDYWQPWDKKEWRIGGELVSLGHIEHDILRKMGEPRIHAAINCASVSCPDLAPEAYVVDRLEEQLSEAFRRFVQDPRKGMSVGVEKGTFYGESQVVRLSSIFSWFAEDFGGRPEAVLRFLEPSMTREQREFVATYRAALKVKYFDYDWTLNGK